jgi:putative YhdH/YhfP family quinone oxidoreductase
VQPAQGEVLVTGATGGVGIFAVEFLAREGFRVVAATGKPEKADFLKQSGATAIIQREELNDTSGRALLHARWAGVVDTVGGNYLATAIASTQPGGAVTCCGNVASPQLHTTVFPFILRGVSLLGIDVNQVTMAERQVLWKRISGDWKVDHLEELYRVVPLQELEGEIQRILKGGQTGRVVVNLD